MAELVLDDLDDHLVALLELRAKPMVGRPEAEHRAILEAALRPTDPSPKMSREEFLERKGLRERAAGRSQIDSTEIIRGFRDRDGAI